MQADVSISAEILRHRRSDRKPEIIPYTPPYRCEISRYPGRRHQGAYLATHAPSDSVCSLLCHLNDRTYSARGCMTANYIAATGLCELINYLAPHNVTRDSGSVNLLNWNCQRKDRFLMTCLEANFDLCSSGPRWIDVTKTSTGPENHDANSRSYNNTRATTRSRPGV